MFYCIDLFNIYVRFNFYVVIVNSPEKDNFSSHAIPLLDHLIKKEFQVSYISSSALQVVKVFLPLLLAINTCMHDPICSCRHKAC